MKQGATQLMGVKIAGGLSGVEKILFKFTQGNNSLTFTYPSNRAVVDATDATVINLHWTYAETYLFEAGKEVRMDTLIKKLGADSTPLTPIKTLVFEPTLFRQAEVSKFYG